MFNLKKGNTEANFISICSKDSITDHTTGSKTMIHNAT